MKTENRVFTTIMRNRKSVVLYKELIQIIKKNTKISVEKWVKEVNITKDV